MVLFSIMSRNGIRIFQSAFLAAALCGCVQSARQSGDGPLTLSGGAPARSTGMEKNPAYKIGQLKVLTPGKYRLIVSGPQCNACTRAVVESLKTVKGVEAASYDFEEGVLWLSVKKDARVRATKVARAVVRAGRRAKLGTRFEITEVRFAD